MPLLAVIVFALTTASSVHAKAPDPAVETCIKAAAATDHIGITDVDRDACVCATRELRASLSGDDFDLHQKMLEVIATGADKKTFDGQMSDIMLKRGMNQQMVNAFLARSKKAEDQAQAKCDASPLLGPAPPTKSAH